MEYNGIIMDQTMALAFNHMFNGLISEYGQVSVLDLYSYPFYLNGLDYVDNMTFKDYAHAKGIIWKETISTGKMFKIKKTLSGTWDFILNLPEPEDLGA